jgi:hypothetical protein
MNERQSSDNLSLEQLAAAKIVARQKLLNLPPHIAQQQASQTLYPNLWDLQSSQDAWKEGSFVGDLIKERCFTIAVSIPTQNHKNYEDMEKLTPAQLKEILLRLQEISLDVVVVGGQAVNLWATRYYQQCPQLEQYLPFASEDLDFYGGKLEAIQCSTALGGRATLNENFDPSPNTGVVLVPFKNKQLRIDFLGSVFGLSDSEISDTALNIEGRDELSGVRLKVLHPLLCLEGKLRALNSLPQSGRQDLKHAQMSVICLNAYLQEVLVAEDPRNSLKLVERIFRVAMNEDGLNAWHQFGIDLFSSIPIDEIRKLSSPKWQNFCLLRLPIATEQINRRREQYQNLMERVNVAKITEPITELLRETASRLDGLLTNMQSRKLVSDRYTIFRLNDEIVLRRNFPPVQLLRVRKEGEQPGWRLTAPSALTEQDVENLLQVERQQFSRKISQQDEL